MIPPNSQEQQQPYLMSTSASDPTLIQEPEQQEFSTSQHTLVDNESIEQTDYPVSQLDLSGDDGERPPLLHAHPAKVELPTQLRSLHHLPKCEMISIIKEWMPEIAMLAFSILLFTAIIVLLWQYDNHPMPSWSFHLNMNSVVAILSTILRSCLFMIIAQGCSMPLDILCSANESNYSNKSTEVELAYSSSSSSASRILRSS
jgi:Protein of unknown function (DUF3176)